MNKWQDIPELTKEVCDEYHRRAMLLPGDAKNVGEKRNLMIEFQEKYGVTEVQAINILDGKYKDEYVRIYAIKRLGENEKKEKETRKEKKKAKKDFGIPDEEDDV